MNRKSVLREMKNHPVFFQRVWRVLMAIPEGEVRTYAWVAKKAGRPRAWRAVGCAVKRNPFAPVVPCHRVVRTDGGIGGYSGPGGSAGKLKKLMSENPGLKFPVEFDNKHKESPRSSTG